MPATAHAPAVGPDITGRGPADARNHSARVDRAGVGVRHRSVIARWAVATAAAVVALGALIAPQVVHADDPPALGKAVAVNDALSRNVVAGVTQPEAATSTGSTASRIGFFTATSTDTTLNF